MLRLVVTFGLTLLATSAAFAQRPLEIVGNQSVYELVLRDVLMPNGAGGTAIFKLCATCDVIAMPVQASTVYAIGGQELAIHDFLEAVEELRTTTDGAAGVGVFWDWRTNRVISIEVFPPR